jgi:ribosome-associated protein
MKPSHARISDWVAANARFAFARSGGPGGQNVNKVSSKAIAMISFDELIGPEGPFGPEGPGEIRAEAMRAKLAARMGADGLIKVAADEERGQLANRARALERLAAAIAKACELPRRRIPTREPERAKAEARRLKALRSRRKAERRAGFEAE